MAKHIYTYCNICGNETRRSVETRYGESEATVRETVAGCKKCKTMSYMELDAEKWRRRDEAELLRLQLEREYEEQEAREERRQATAIAAQIIKQRQKEEELAVEEELRQMKADFDQLMSMAQQPVEQRASQPKLTESQEALIKAIQMLAAREEVQKAAQQLQRTETSQELTESQEALIKAVKLLADRQEAYEAAQQSHHTETSRALTNEFSTHEATYPSPPTPRPVKRTNAAPPRKLEDDQDEWGIGDYLVVVVVTMVSIVSLIFCAGFLSSLF